METALGRIIAVALVFIDAVRSNFVIANWASSGFDNSVYGCGLSSYTASLTNCGQYIADQMAIVESWLDLFPQILPALGIA